MIPNRNISEKIRSFKDIGRHVRGRRKDLGLTQQRCADLCGVGRRFLSELENGKPSLEIGLVFDVLAGLGLRISISRPSLRHDDEPMRPV